MGKQEQLLERFRIPQTPISTRAEIYKGRMNCLTRQALMCIRISRIAYLHKMAIKTWTWVSLQIKDHRFQKKELKVAVLLLTNWDKVIFHQESILLRRVRTTSSLEADKIQEINRPLWILKISNFNLRSTVLKLLTSKVYKVEAQLMGDYQSPRSSLINKHLKT